MKTIDLLRSLAKATQTAANLLEEALECDDNTLEDDWTINLQGMTRDLRLINSQVMDRLAATERRLIQETKWDNCSRET